MNVKSNYEFVWGCKMELDEITKELLKKLLIDNLEIKISTPDERIEVSLLLFGETISSDYIYR